MILAIDIGNSRTKLGVFDGAKLIKRFTIPTIRSKSADEIYDSIQPEITQQISSVIISSVVPELENSFRKLAERYFNSKAAFVDNKFDSGLKIRYFPPENLGTDRLIAAFAAVGKYGKPIIICDFGTATTIDVVNSKSEYLGGIITPGINTLGEALFTKTSKLPRVEIKKPESVIGNSTVSSIQAGIFYGYIGLVEGILRRMSGELDEKSKVVATGGFAKLLAESCDLIEIVDENLMLDGLRLIHEKEKDFLPTKHTKYTKKN
ncbi:MAG: type III pantothenate kinase [Pyrinomonadaceae bacterium]